jgi:hypothetical protein
MVAGTADRDGIVRPLNPARPMRIVASVLLALAIAGCSTSTVPSASAPDRLAPSSTPTASRPPDPPPTLRPTAAPVPSELAVYALPQLAGLIHDDDVASVAGGPSGFVLLGSDRATGALLSWTSADGDDWTRHWLPGSTFGGGSPDILVGGAFGYLALGWRAGDASFGRALWISPDGVDWSPASETGMPAGRITSLVSGRDGVAAAVDLGKRGGAVVTTRDGQSWSAADLPGGPVPRGLTVVARPDGLSAYGRTVSPEDTEIGTPSAWTTFNGSTWVVDPVFADEVASVDDIGPWQLSPLGLAASSGFDETVAVFGPMSVEPIDIPADASGGTLLGGSAGLFWIRGGDLSASCFAGWRRAGGGWVALVGARNDAACIDTAEPTVHTSASIAGATLVLGSLGGSPDAVAWLVRAPDRPTRGGAAPDPSPVAPASSIPDALAVAIERPAGCPAMPSTLRAVVDIPPLDTVGCFGDRTISFRAWIADPEDGSMACVGSGSPGWIHACGATDYLLAAGKLGGPGSDVTLHGVRAPTATGALDGVRRWVRIEGHFDDPVAPSCRAASAPTFLDLMSLEPPGLAILRCRLAFVVTDVRPAP